MKLPAKITILILLLFSFSGIFCTDQNLKEKPMKIDHSNLTVFYDENGQPQSIKDLADWAKRRSQILAGMEEAMGPLPDRKNLQPLDVQVHEEIQFSAFTRQKISLLTEPGHRLFAYLFVPKNLKSGEKAAGVLALHPTHPMGKGDTAGITGRKNRSYGLELAQRGFVVLAPDYPSFGDDSTYNFASDRYVSGTMKGIFNHMRCVDFLCSLEIVDSTRLGVIGHSLGGHNAMFVGVFDERLKVIVSSSGWTPFHDYYDGNIKGWTSDRYMPRLKNVYELDPDRVPFDFYEIVAALAPRAFFSNSPLHDNNFAVTGIQKAIPEALKIYQMFGAAEQLQVRYPDSGHDFPPEIREEAYEFMESVLSR